MADKVKFTKYERARMIGSRALQISQGAPFEVKISKKRLEELKYNPVEIAKLEFEAGVIPISIKKPVPDTAARKAEDKKEKA